MVPTVPTQGAIPEEGGKEKKRRHNDSILKGLQITAVCVFTTYTHTHTHTHTHTILGRIMH